MTATDTHRNPPAPPHGRVLRRSRTGRVGAGVASGLGEYFGFDPVLFRVLFATSAFFGGAGVIAYLIAWAAIPEEGTQRAPIDGWVASLRRRQIPFWVVAVIAGLVLWLAAFSWWAPGPFLPVLAVVVILVVTFGRRDWQGARSAAGTSERVNLTKDGAPPAGGPTTQPGWVGDFRAWADEAKAAGRARRRRTLPIRIGIVAVLAATLIVLGIVDATNGIALPLYFWLALGIVVAGLLVGLVTRRTPWSVVPLLVPIGAGLIAFGGTHAGLHDGIGQRDWRPVTTATTHYRLAFGQGNLDLRALPAATTARRIDVTVAAGQVRIIAPKTLKLTVHANVRFGQLTVDGDGSTTGHGGVGLSRIVDPLAGATGAPVTVDVHLADGQVLVDHR